MSATETLVAFICDRHSPSPRVLHIVDLCLLDWVSVTHAARNEPVARLIRETTARQEGRPEAWACGLDRAVPARAAALINGVTSHALDYDDTHFASLGHPSVTVFPAVLAIADREGASMADVKRAALIGAEASIRIGMWLGRSHYRTGFHVTGTAGTFGAVAGAAHLLKLSSEQTRMALGIAASLAAGVKAQFGTMGKPMHAGLAAAAGVDAVLWAEAGLIAAQVGLEGSQGFAATHHAEANDAAFADLGRHYLLCETSHKFHACCHGTHAMLEALSALRDTHGLTPGSVSSVTITVHPQYLDICNIQEPATGLEAKFSYRQLAAMVLHGIPTDRLDSFSDDVCTNTDIAETRNRVVVRTDPSFSETGALVAVRTAGGAHVTSDHDHATPLEAATRTARVLAKSKALLEEHRCTRIWSRIQNPEAVAQSPGRALLDL